MVKKALNLDIQIQAKLLIFTNGKIHKQRQSQKWMYTIEEDIDKRNLQELRQADNN